MDRKEEVYEPALMGKNIPILTLDNKWHRLFTQTGSTDRIRELEKEVNDILKEHGRLQQQVKDVKRLKKKLMDELLNDSMDEGSNEKAVSERKRLIEDCNQKLDDYQDALLDIEPNLQKKNHELMLETMEVCYETIKENNERIKTIGDWITKIRVELKKNLVRKQESEIKNNELYAYMHDIFGADVIEMFDMKYNPQNPPKKGGEVSNDDRK